MGLEFTRQDRIYMPIIQRGKVHIFGCGSTGSFISLNLAKMGVKNIIVYDFDKIEEANIPNQFYRLKDVSQKKTEALGEMIEDFSGEKIKKVDGLIDDKTELELGLFDTIILCFDNIEARKIIFDKIEGYPVHLIDTRMGGEGYQVYTLDMSSNKDTEFYKELIEGKTMEAPCGQKSIIYTISSISAEVCNIYKKIQKGEQYPRILKREMSGYVILNS